MSYEDENAEQQRRNSDRQQEERPRKRRKFGLFWYRTYTPMVVVWEVFFRTRMGERYFGIRLFLGGLVMLGIVQTLSFKSMLGYDFFEVDPDKDFYITSPFDWVMGAYVLMGLWHLWHQRRLYAKGIAPYSYYAGNSRLRPIGKWFFKLINFIISLPFRLFKAKPFQFSSKVDYYFSYYLLEPFAALIITIILSSVEVLNSLALLLLGIMGALQLWWQNIKKVRTSYLGELDGRDSQRMSEHIDLEARERQQKAARAMPPPLPSKMPKSMPPLPKKGGKVAMPSVEDALKKLNPNLKDLGDAE